MQLHRRVLVKLACHDSRWSNRPNTTLARLRAAGRVQARQEQNKCCLSRHQMRF